MMMQVPMRALILAAAISAALHTAPAEAKATKSDDCTLPSGWSAVEAEKPQYVVFGELHGTREGPAFVGNLVCALAKQKRRVLVNLELFVRSDANLQRALVGPPADFKASLTGEGWRGRQDGIASEAMFALIDKLRQLRVAGYRVDVAYFSGSRDDNQANRFADLPGQGPHDAMQAENIALAARARPYDVVVVFVGNFHARKVAVAKGGATFTPMAQRLGQYGKVISLEMAYGAGTSWNCQLKPGVAFKAGTPVKFEDMTCGAKPTTGTADGQTLTIELKKKSDKNETFAFDGTFWVGAVSASQPALP